MTRKKLADTVILRALHLCLRFLSVFDVFHHGC